MLVQWIISIATRTQDTGPAYYFKTVGFQDAGPA